MQQHMGQSQEVLKETKERLAAAEEERDRALDELGEMKRVAQEANMRLTETLSAQKSAQGSSEIEKSRVNELERSIESARKRDKALQMELEAVRKQHESAMEALSSSSEQLNLVSQKLALASKEKDAALKETEQARNVAEVNARKVAELSAELNSMQEAMANSNRDLEFSLKTVESLKLELEEGKLIEVKLREKDALLDNMKHELSVAKMANSMDLISESRMIVQKLEDELVKAKESETKVFDSLVSQTKQLEQTKILLEESKLEIASLNQKVESLEGLVVQSNGDLNLSQPCIKKEKLDKYSSKGAFAILQSELQLVKKCLTRDREGEEFDSSKACSLSEEISLLKNELKLAVEAEEKSKEAMDDLALALKEVAAEAQQLKEELISSLSELENAKREAEHFQQDNDRLKEEIDRITDVAERLRLESEESTLTWNGKEVGFINCIKIAEEEITVIQQENDRLMDALRVAEDTKAASREGNHKLRDILKQALNEANMAKEAAGIARAENYQLKDSLSEKDNALEILVQENERLRISEASALENIKELKRLLPLTSTEDSKADDRELGRAFENHYSTIQGHKDDRELSNLPSLNLKETKARNGYKGKEADKDHEKAETLKGSIFDLVDHPNTGSHHHTSSSSLFTDDGETMNSDDFDHLGGTQADMENERNSQRKKRALLRKFSDILRRSCHRREPSFDQVPVCNN